MPILHTYIPSIALLLTALLLQGCFFFPRSDLPVVPTDLKIDYEVMSIDGDDEPQLISWLLKSKTMPPKAVILFLHGNAQNISYHLPSVAWLPAQGYHVFMLDYRGFGLSQGSPDIGGALTDINRALRHLKIRYPELKLVLFGQSIGGTLGLWSLANSTHRETIAAAIIESPFSSYRRIAREKIRNIPLMWPLLYPLTWLIADRWSPERIAEPIRLPILLLHGTLDQIVPVNHSRQLKYLLNDNSSYLEVDGADHLQVLSSQAVRDMLLSFLRNNT